YIRNDSTLTTISQDLFKDYSKIRLGLREYAITEKNFKTDKKIDLFLKQKYFSISEIEQGLKLIGFNKSISDYFKSFKLDDKDLFSEITDSYDKFKNIKYDPNGDRFDIGEKTEKGDLIKQFLDSIMDLLHFIKPLYVSLKNKPLDDDKEKKSEAYELDSSFYTEFNDIYEKLLELIKIYNQTRNYITKKPFVTKKFKLNFNNSTLLDGWDKNKEKDNFGVLFKKENYYYLGILNPENKKILDNLETSENVDALEKMVYKLLPGPNKMLPKVFFSKGNIKYYNPSNEIIDIRNHSSHTKNGKPQEGYEKKDFNLDDCHKFIDFLKESLSKHPEWGVFNFKFKETKKYADSSEFYLDVANQGYIIDFIKLNYESILDLVDSGKFYLFQIYNKDYSKNKGIYNKGKKNLHTIYWEELFSKENLKNVVYKLNGEAELFYREKSLPAKITHPKNQNIDNKDPINNKKTSCFDYDLIKDKRYTEDKFLFHCPITLNFKQKDLKSINNEVNKIIKSNEVNILSIDRGERNLLYYTLLDSNGNILSQNSLNSVFDDLNRKSDYKAKLDSIEGKRKDARQNWHKIVNIKELKEGYLSQVIYKISKMAVENNAIIVLEDLNYGFKKGRFKIEKQVYQKFEKMLIDKLNYLMFKEKDSTEIGGSLKAYQLTSKFDSFKKLGKQSGIIFYVPASYTSKICPKTGFINFIYPKFENIKQAQDLLNKFQYIKYHPAEDLFEFNFNYSDFKSKNDKTKLIKDNWSIWSNGIKLKQFRNSEKNNMWDTKEVNVTEELKKLFKDYEMDYTSENDIKDQVININSKEFLEKLIDILKLILQLRNSRSNSDEDYILSCVKGKDDKFFDSRSAKDNEPKDADANGAYHIGLKGLMIIDKIKNQESDKKVDLRLQNNDYINERIKRCN
ncbi:MAG: type V CRISPR-associated protein Cas12a/Cpf1, partial [Candidatus ainarchaeum sp.]|nr:type V CRISPR-associated protein Cas12a/Cpf1 [Candidatus ainarchaeum sp.]